MALFLGQSISSGLIGGAARAAFAAPAGWLAAANTFAQNTLKPHTQLSAGEARKQGDLMSYSRTSLAAAAVAAVVLAAAPVAAGDSVDAQFLGDVRGISNPSLATLIDAAPDVVVKAGRSVCAMLDDGYGGGAVKGMVLDRLSLYGENREYYAGLFAVYAVSNYCPAHKADSGFNGNY